LREHDKRSRHRLWFLAAGMLWGGLLTVGVAARAGDVSALVHFAPPNTDPLSASPEVTVLAEGSGYDGQFYYRLAVSPFSTERVVAGITFDDPALRMGRIGFPALVRLAALADTDAVPAAMVLVNVISFGLIAVFAADLAHRAGRRPEVGLVLLTVPSFIYGATMSITDTLAGAALLGGVLACIRGSWLAAAVALSLAALTRETTLMIPLALAVVGLFADRFDRPFSDRRSMLLTAGAPLACTLVWQFVVYVTWDGIGIFGSGQHNLTLPFLGPFQTSGYFSLSSGAAVLGVILPLGCAAIVGAGMISLVAGPRPPDFVVVGLVIAAVVTTLLGPALLESFRNSGRAMGDAVTLAALAALWGRSRWATGALAAVVAIGIAVAAWELRVAGGLA
jgi:hypothetical protein